MLDENCNRSIEYFVTSKLMDLRLCGDILHYLVEEDNLKMIKLFIENGADTETGNFRDNKPLHTAAFNGRFEICKYLISQRADIDAKNYFGETAMHLAAEMGELEIVKLLIENGADYHVKNYNEITPFDAAAFADNEVAKYFVKEKNLRFIPFECVDRTDLDEYGNTPLHRAVLDGNLDLVKNLIEQKSEDIFDTNYLGQTALRFAISKGHLHIVKYFSDLPYRVSR